MRRTARRTLVWTALLAGCSAQPFCELEDGASVQVLPTSDGYPAESSFGEVLAAMELQAYPGSAGPGVYVAMSSGPGTQIEAYQVAEGGEPSLVLAASLKDICTVEDRNDEEHDCHGRLPGSALAYRSTWRGRGDCLVVGMAGRAERRGGLGFWCVAGGAPRLHTPTPSDEFVPVEEGVLSLATAFAPEERLFLGTRQNLQVLEGGLETVTVPWEGAGLPSLPTEVSALHLLEDPGVDGGVLLAAGLPAQRSVLVGTFVPDDPDTAESEARLVPVACVAMDEPGFGSVVRLARLEPGGPPVLLASAASGHPGRVPAVHIFELDQSVAPEDVSCGGDSLSLSLRCAPVVDDQGHPSDADVDCSMETSELGVAFDVGDIDDTPEAEVVVGAPGAMVDGADRAGAAFVFRPARDGASPRAVLTDSRESAGVFDPRRDDDRLGASVLLVPVGDRDEVLLASPGTRRLPMFFCTGTGVEPPAWDHPTNRTGSFVDPLCRIADQ